MNILENVNKYTESLNTYYELAITQKYYAQQLGSSLDDYIATLVSEIYQNKNFNIADLCLNEKAIKILTMFAERMSSLSVRENSVRHLELAIKSLLLASSFSISKNSIMVLSLIYHSSILLNLDETFYDQFTKTYDKNSFLKRFLEREEQDKSIESMGYSADNNEYGFIYKRLW